MALVAYGASDDSDLSEEEEEEVTKNPVPGSSAVKPASFEANGHISDEEDEFLGGGGNEDLIPEKEEPDVFSLIAKKLPQALKAKKKVEVVEETGPIPEKKDYGDKVEEPPAKKAKRSGPVKITIPSLSTFKDEEEEALPSVRVEPSKAGSGLFALLPQPKNKPSRPKAVVPIRPTPDPAAAVRKPLASNIGGNNLKPSGVRTVGLVPHRVANPVKAKPGGSKPANSDSDDEDDLLGMGSSSNSYFPAPAAPVREQFKVVNPTPAGPSSSMRSLNPALPADPSFVSLNMADDISATGTRYQDLELGPAVAPYPPPAPTYPEARDSLIDNEEAITRLAGKSAKLKEFKDDLKGNIIDINEDDMKGNPIDWMTKAMTQEQAPRPSGKGPKGLAKSRHQITYLAHQAKERDWELKQEWASSRENRNASRNKYGFI